MNEILDDELATNKRPKSLYGKYSNLPAAVVILGALYKIMHWPYGEYLLLFGICAHFGIELGYGLALKFSSKLNNRRLVVATFFLVFMSGFWKIKLSQLNWLDAIYIVLILTSIVATYWLVKRKSRKQNTFT
ncbi:MAG: hypothetical protein ACI8SE_001630 [Bacteroidia bacterium]|jgi:hypothetical protein